MNSFFLSDRRKGFPLGSGHMTDPGGDNFVVVVIDIRRALLCFSVCLDANGWLTDLYVFQIAGAIWLPA